MDPYFKNINCFTNSEVELYIIQKPGVCDHSLEGNQLSSIDKLFYFVLLKFFCKMILFLVKLSNSIINATLLPFYGFFSGVLKIFT